MIKKDLVDEQAYSLVMQDLQLSSAQAKLGQIDGVMNQLNSDLDKILLETQDSLNNSEFLIGEVERELLEFSIVHDEEIIFIVEEEKVAEEIFPIQKSSYTPLSLLETITFSKDNSWSDYQRTLKDFQEHNGIYVSEDPFMDLMTPSQKVALQKRIKEEFSLKNANCDQYDYMIAGTCGVIGGLVDVLFVGMPGQSPLGNLTDDATNQAVQLFAKMNGWNKEEAEKKGVDLTSSAISKLENIFKVNYDQRYGGDVEHLFKMNTRNHHIKNLAHSPDLCGLFFSLLDQFQSTATFVGIFDVINDEGVKIGESSKLVRINTNTFELQGTNLISKIYCGFVNWLGHLFSDVAGSSSASTRGSGIPIPFYSLLQFADFGSFGQHRQSFATLAVRVFQAGYDFRHGMTMAIPVLITELLTRFMWSFKQRIYHHKDWLDCIPLVNVPEVRRMLLVAHGTLCIIDGLDAGIKSAGEPVQFLLRTNLIGWSRFSLLALKEVQAKFREGDLDLDAVDEYLDKEYRRLKLSPY